MEEQRSSITKNVFKNDLLSSQQSQPLKHYKTSAKKQPEPPTKDQSDFNAKFVDDHQALPTINQRRSIEDVADLVIFTNKKRQISQLHRSYETMSPSPKPESSIVVDQYNISTQNKAKVRELVNMLKNPEQSRQQNSRSEQSRFSTIQYQEKDNISDLINLRPKAALMQSLQTTGMAKKTINQLRSKRKEITSDGDFLSKLQPVKIVSQSTSMDTTSLAAHSSLNQRRQSFKNAQGKIINLGYIVQQGQLQPSSNYIMKSPFIKVKQEKQQSQTQARRGDLSLSVDKEDSILNYLSQIDDHYSEAGYDLDIEELSQHNEQLKQQLLSQITVFEQYIKVASLSGFNDLAASTLVNLQKSLFGSVQRPASKQSDSSLVRLTSVQSLTLATNSVIESYLPHRSEQLSKQYVSMPKVQPSAQQLWQQKIKRLNQELSECKDQDIRVQQDELRRKQDMLQCLQFDNSKEAELLKAKDKQFNDAKKKHQQKSLPYDFTKEEILIQDKIKYQIKRRNELSSWAFGNYVISYRVKVREVEDLIDTAMKLQKSGLSDQEASKQIEKLQRLRDQAQSELHNFVKLRDKVHWRTWDRCKQNNWREFMWFRCVDTRKDLSDSLTEEQHKFDRAIRVGKSLNLDFQSWEQINVQMQAYLKSHNIETQFILRLVQLKELRKLQLQNRRYDSEITELMGQPQSPISPQPLSPCRPSSQTSEKQITFTKEVNQPITLPNKPQKVIQSPQHADYVLAAGSELKPSKPKTVLFKMPEPEKIQQTTEPAVESQLPNVSEVTVPAKRLEIPNINLKDSQSLTQDPKRESGWMSLLAKRKQPETKVVDPSKSERMARLAHLFDDSADETADQLADQTEDKLDQMAANQNLQKFLQKVEGHLQHEKVLIDEWRK